MHERQREAIEPDSRENEYRGRQAERLPHDVAERRRKYLGERVQGVRDHWMGSPRISADISRDG